MRSKPADCESPCLPPNVKKKSARLDDANFGALGGA